MKQRRGLLTEPSQPPARPSRRRCDPGLRHSLTEEHGPVEDSLTVAPRRFPPRVGRVLGLGRRATAEGRRGFPPTVGHPAKPSRRGATIEPSPHDQRSISFAPLPPRLQSSLRDESFLCHRSAAADGLKPTATIKCRSATDGATITEWDSAITTRSLS